MARIRLPGTADSAAAPVRRGQRCICNRSAAKASAGVPVSAKTGSPSRRARAIAFVCSAMPGRRVVCHGSDGWLLSVRTAYWHRLWLQASRRQHSSPGRSVARWPSSSVSAGCSPSTGQRGSSGSFLRVTGCRGTQDVPWSRRPLRGVTPRRKTGLPDPSPAEEWMQHGTRQHPLGETSLLLRPGRHEGCRRRERGQRETRRARRTRPAAVCRSDQAMISDRSHSFTRLSPRSTTGRGISS